MVKVGFHYPPSAVPSDLDKRSFTIHCISIIKQGSIMSLRSLFSEVDDTYPSDLASLY